jgi:hypothetical protein
VVPTISPLVTFIGALIGLLAIALIPSNKQIKKGNTERFTSWGKMAVVALAIVLFVLAGAVMYTWVISNSEELFSLGNFLLFLGLGIGLVANNVLVTAKITMAQNEKEPSEVHEVEELGPKESVAPAKDARPKKATRPKTSTKPFKPEVAPAVGKPLASPKIPVKAKVPKLMAPPKPKVSEELIAPPLGPKKCPSCDTPLDHHQDKTCPVCGHDLTS